MVRVQIQLPDDIYTAVESPWEAPIVEGLGWKGLTHGEIKDVAQRTPVEEELEERARTPTRV